MVEYSLERGFIPDDDLDSVIKDIDKPYIVNAIKKQLNKIQNQKLKSLYALYNRTQTALSFERKMALKDAEKKRSKNLRKARRLRRMLENRSDLEEDKMLHLINELVSVEKELLLTHPTALDEVSQGDKRWMKK